MTLYMETTKIDPSKTVAEIQAVLGRYGASSILTEYKNSEIEALSFCVTVNGQPVPFRLPCRHEAVYKTMIGRMSKLRESRIDDYKLQAKRVAWRQVLRWIQAQMAMVETSMVSVEEVFLPYIQHRSGKTLFELIKQNNFKMLEGPKP